MIRKSEKTADICLLLEGTYPYVRGGVSSWVHQIISGLSEFSFSLIFLGSEEKQYGEMRYELPDNVIHIEQHFLMTPRGKEPWQRRKSDPDMFHKLDELHADLRDKKRGEAVTKSVFTDFTALAQQSDKLNEADFLYSREAWEMIRRKYLEHCPELSFQDYFWTLRTMHAPLFKLLDVARNAPKARLYHTISTGYAGFLGAMLRHFYQKPLLLSEHGIYTKERKIDLAQAKWIKDNEDFFRTRLDGQSSYLRQLWIRFFQSLGSMTYTSTDLITSLYGNNRDLQIRDGAPADKIIITPNGINLSHLKPLREKRLQKVPPVLGLIGRVVPIKDIKMFIRTMHSVANKIPEAEGWIIGPDDEDKDYAQECHDLVKNLGLEDKVKFLGFQKIADILPKIGLMTLTSISEGQPLVILEGFAAGVPTLATDVGACRELVEGGSEEDKALGAAGAIVPIASPAEAAKEAVALLTDEKRWYAAQKAAIARVEMFYTQEQLFDKYRKLYQDYLK